jgi:hypothetical protein
VNSVLLERVDCLCLAGTELHCLAVLADIFELLSDSHFWLLNLIRHYTGLNFETVLAVGCLSCVQFLPLCHTRHLHICEVRESKFGQSLCIGILLLVKQWCKNDRLPSFHRI